LQISLPQHNRPLFNRFKVRGTIPDWRDFIYKSSNNPLRDVVDLRPWASPVENQLHLGSCVGQAVVGAYELLIKKNNSTDFEDLSKLFVYYNARLIEGHVDEDDGAYVRDAVKAVYTYGICAEKLWPYDTSLFSVSPTINSYEDAKLRTIKNYYKVNGLNNILDALNRDYPIVASMHVYSNFNNIEYSKDFILTMPSAADDLIGGHALVLVGYDLNKKLVLCRNSFGEHWCMNGYFWVPFDYISMNFIDNWIFDIDVNKRQDATTFMN
jgi:C1A family cysteine protease